MALTTTWELALDSQHDDYIAKSPGVYRIGEKELLCGIADWSGDDATNSFYRSLDGGDTWVKISERMRPWGNPNSIAIHFPDRIVCYASTDPDQRTFKIYRSTDGGDTWSTVYTHDDGPDNPVVSFVADACTNRLTHGIFVGGFEGYSGGWHKQWMNTDDAGASWSTGTTFPGTGTGIAGSAICATPGGIIFAADELGATYKSTTYGATWTATATRPLPTSPEQFAAGSLQAITDTKIICAGTITGSSGPRQPGLYISDDSGATWTRFSSGDISGWPTSGSARPNCSNVQRITRDCCALGMGVPSPLTMGSVILSNNGLADFTITGTGWPSDGANFLSAAGKIAVSHTGKILVVIDANDFPHGWSQLYRGTVSC